MMPDALTMSTVDSLLEAVGLLTGGGLAKGKLQSDEEMGPEV